MKNKLYLLILILGCSSLLACHSNKLCDYGREPESNANPTSATLCVDKGFYELGETVHIELTVKNISGQTLVLQDKKSVLDIVIKGGEPYQEWVWSAAHPAPAAALIRLELAANQTKTITWDLTLPQNNIGYGVYGHWKRSDGLTGEVRRIVGVGSGRY